MYIVSDFIKRVQFTLYLIFCSFSWSYLKEIANACKETDFFRTARIIKTGTNWTNHTVVRIFYGTTDKIIFFEDALGMVAVEESIADSCKVMLLGYLISECPSATQHRVVHNLRKVYTIKCVLSWQVTVIVFAPHIIGVIPSDVVSD